MSEKREKNTKKYIIIGCVCLVLILGAVGAYAGGTVYYQSHFFPNTSINGMECGNMEAAEVIQMLDGRISDYALEVTGRDCRTGEPGAVLGRVQPEDIHLTFEGTKEAVESFLGDQETLYWIQSFFGKGSSYSLDQDVIFDEDLLKSTVAAWDACKKENMLKPEDAYIGGYSEAAHCYEIMPETGGTVLDVDKMVGLMADAVSRRDTSLDIEGQDCYSQAALRQDDKSLTDIVDTINSWLGTKITYDWNGTEVILDYETLKDWVSIEDGVPVLDEEQVGEFVKAQAKQYDTYGKKRNFTTTLGVELTLPSGYYGWKTDRETEKAELIELIYQGSVTDREPVYSDTAMQKGMDDIGDSYVEVDIMHQHVYLYKEGELVLETDCVTGNTSLGRDTPEGVFCIAYRQKNAVLRGRDYETPVTYWMPFYGNYGMHDAYWRSAFGGKIYKTNGSRGCVNLPPAVAEEMFDNVRKGFPVICYFYKEDPLLNQNTSGQTGTSEGNTAVSTSGGAVNDQTSESAGQGTDAAADASADETTSPASETDPAAGEAERQEGDQVPEVEEPGMNDPVDPVPNTQAPGEPQAEPSEAEVADGTSAETETAPENPETPENPESEVVGEEG